MPLFGKTTGSTQCDGYAAGRLFLQGAELKNPEFIQFHPTTLETAQKRMLISDAAREIAERSAATRRPDFAALVRGEEEELRRRMDTRSPFPAIYVRDMLADTMRRHLGILRDEESLTRGIEDIDYDLSVADRILYDSSVPAYINYSLTGILTIAAVAAMNRRPG